MTREAMRFALASALSLGFSACQGGGTTPPPLRESPSRRSSPMVAFDDTRGVVLLFGGSANEMLGDFWSWNGTEWSRLTPAGAAPSARDDAVFAFDDRRGRAVMVFGRSGSTLHADLWEWDGTTWSSRPNAGPGARLHAVGAFDKATGRLRIYGGLNAADDALTDTWEWDGNTWTRVATSGPSNRIPNHMVFDEQRQRTVMSMINTGAQNADRTYQSDLWEWSGTAWTQVGGTGPAFSPKQPMAGTGATGLLLVDGGALQGTFATWKWDGTAWSLSNTSGPSPRNGHAVIFDRARQRVLLFGGFRNGQEFGDTWTWDGTTWTDRTTQ